MGMWGTLGVVCFSGTFVLSTVWAAFMMKVVSLLGLGLSKKEREEVCLRIIKLAWSVAFALSPWLRRSESASYADEWELLRKQIAIADAKAAAKQEAPKPLFVMGNHTSFLNAPLSSVHIPLWAFVKARTYMGDHLFNIPVLSTVCYGVGHFPVYFCSNTEGSFKVHPKQAEVAAQVKEHVGAGGYMLLYPEGTINKNPDQMLPLRWGGMKECIDSDARIMLFITYGDHVAWPKTAAAGGFPATLPHEAKALCPEGTVAYLKALRQGGGLSDDDQKLEDRALLAKYMQMEMQKVYDKLKAQVQGGSKKTD